MENYLKYDFVAKKFEEALPLGNGTLGAMVYGNPECEKISLNHDTLWSGKPREYTNPTAVSAFKRAQQMVLNGEYEKATSLLEEEFTCGWGNSYLPLGNIYIKNLGLKESLNYSRELDLSKATATVKYSDGENGYVCEYFVSHPDKCVVVRYRSEYSTDYEIGITSQVKNEICSDGENLILKGECPSVLAPDYARDFAPTVYDGKGIKFTGAIKVKSDGEVTVLNDKFIVKNATCFILIFTAETSFIKYNVAPDKDSYTTCLNNLRLASDKSYEELADAHVLDFNSYYSRVELSIDGFHGKIETDNRLKSESKDKDVGLIELLFNFGRYLIISASREDSKATNLQGIWNEKLFAAWSSNYTLNINTEMNYWPVLMCNLYGFDQPIINLIKVVSETGVNTAKNFYGIEKGFCAHHNTDLWGLTTPVGAKVKGSLVYAIWCMASGWLCRHLWERYEYTLDMDFLKDTAYPIIKNASLFYLELMVKDGDKYIVTPTTSPENNYYAPNGQKTAIARFTTMSQAIVYDLFDIADKSAKILGIKDEFTDKISERLPHILTHTVGSKGQLLEFDKEYDEVEPHHRHNSHLYGLYPGESITTGATPEIANACRRTLELRGDESTGWSMVWRIILWNKLKDGDHALKLLKNQLNFVTPTDEINYDFGGGTYPNMFDAHPPFQIDGNFGVVAGIAQFFLQCEDGKIYILPALPTEYKNGYIKGLKAKGNVTVDITFEEGKAKELSLVSPHDIEVTVVVNGSEMKVTLEKNKKEFITFE